MVITFLTGLMLTIASPADGTPLPQQPTTVRAAEGPSTIREEPPRLDGRVLVVRVYSDWSRAPGEFEPLRIPVRGSYVALEPEEDATPPVIVVAAEDQEDEIVKKAVGSTIWAQSLAKKLDLVLPSPQDQDRAGRPWQFTDALGEPLAGAAVEIWLVDYRGPRIRLGRTTLGPAGRLASRMLLGDLRTSCFVVSHPDYGCAEIREPFEPDRNVIVPLVRRGTVAAERAIRGRVVDPNGVPVAGATIHCPYVRTLGEGLINGLGGVYKSITDVNGVFSFYLPNRKMRDDRGDLIPPKAQYSVRVEAPAAFGLLPYAEPIENGRETLIVLERGDRVRRLRFEDQDGPITDPNRLRNITVRLRRPGRSILTLHYDDWKAGAALPLGTCEASMFVVPGECRFEPVEITRASPPELVFKLPAAVTYYGRVVHGVTGRPMPGAFVLAMSSSSNKRLCDLTAEQWDALHGLAGNPDDNDAALEPLRRIYGMVRLVRTDAAGCYGLALEPNETFYGFVIFEQDYLAVMHRRHALQADAQHFAEVPTIKLFPAATVFVETAAAKEHPSIMPKWEIEEPSQPAWVQELLGIDSNPESSLEYDDWLRPNARQPVHVPAGVRLRLKLEMPYDEEFCPILIPHTICLMQGETADLGRHAFEPALTVQVRAVDSAGQALEGIPIRMVQIRPDGPHWGVPHSTDEHGVARFHVVPNSTGSFGVLYHNDSGVHLKETVDYQVGGPQDAAREFVLLLSEEMLAFLLH